MACLIFSDISGRQTIFELRGEAVRIGRAGDNDIVSDDLRMSRHHAVVTKEKDGFRIRDKGSSLGVHVNNRRVEEASLEDGDLIRMGDSLFTFVDEVPPTADSMEGPRASDAEVVGSALVSGVEEAARTLRSAFEAPEAGSEGSSAPETSDALTRMESSLDRLRGRIARIERARRTLQSLYEIGKLLNSSLNNENLLDITMDLGLKVLGAERGFLMLLEGEEKQLAVKAARNMEAELAEDSPDISVGIARQVALSGEPVLTSDAMSDRRFSDHRSVVDFRIRSVVCVPLPDRAGRPMGVIYVDNRAVSEVFDEEDRDFLTAFANYAAIAIENQRLLGEAAARARMQEELRAARRLDEWKSQLMSIVAHDVRTPLTSIRSYAEILGDDFEEIEPGQRKEFLDLIVREAERLNRLTSDYLDLAQIEAGKMGLRLAKVEPSDLVRETCEAFQGQASAQGIHLHSKIEGDPDACRADRDRLLQVLANLVSNALKFTPKEGEVCVAAKAELLPADRPAVHFEVADTGLGIEAEDIDRLFRKFGQVGQPRAGRARGTGLGLVVAREIVELHGGRIGVKSRPGEGSCFFFVIPVAGPEEGGGEPDTAN
jgi:signal transduction histidine kinase